MITRLRKVIKKYENEVKSLQNHLITTGQNQVQINERSNFIAFLEDTFPELKEVIIMDEGIAIYCPCCGHYPVDSTMEKCKGCGQTIER